MQTIKRGKKVLCVTEVDYPASVVKEMKKAGLKVEYDKKKTTKRKKGAKS